jgi:hypothetical protein
MTRLRQKNWITALRWQNYMNRISAPNAKTAISAKSTQMPGARFASTRKQGSFLNKVFFMQSKAAESLTLRLAG